MSEAARQAAPEITLLGPGGARHGVAESGLPGLLDAARGNLARPFAPARMELAARVSTRVLRAPKATTSAAIVHFAYWTRAAALQRLARQFEQRLPENCLARPRGVVFHLPPQNVETVFLYSWMLAWLAGNANIVRVPAALGPEVAALLALFLEELAAAGERTQLFVQYPSDSAASQRISAASDARVVWGGDAKVRAFATMALRHGGKALWFGDRFSFAVLHGAALAGLDEAARRALAERFFNDVFVFEQMACSSPHTLYVVGDAEACRPGVNAFLAEVAACAHRRAIAVPTGHAMRKLVEAFAALGRGDARSAQWHDPLLTTVEAGRFARYETRVGGGYLSVLFVGELDELSQVIREHDQTMTHFGFGREVMERFARDHAGAGLSRIVPVGAALDFDFVWDGYDLLNELTRLVRVA